MGVEVPYNYDFVRLELALGQDLHTEIRPGEDGDVAVLSRAQQFTAVSVLDGVTKALDSARANHTGGAPFDRENWFPDNETVASIREQHSAHLRYLRGIEGLKAYHKEIVEGRRTFADAPRELQVEELAKAITYLEGTAPFAADEQGAFSELAGGIGKSFIIAMVTEGFKYKEDPNNPNRVAIIVPDKAVQDEIMGRNGESGLGKYAPDLEPGEVNAALKQTDREVVVYTRESARRALAADPKAFEAYDLIISDEAHTLTAVQTQTAVRGIRRPILGYTGTAKYDERRTVASVLPTQLSKHTAAERIAEGDLSPVQSWICKTNLVIYRDSGRADYTQAELDVIAGMEERHEVAADIGFAFFRDNRSGFFVCNNVREAIQFAESLDSTTVTLADGSSRTIRMEAMFGRSLADKEYNLEIRQRLSSGDLDAITIVGLDTGWDVPQLSFGVSLSPTLSLVRAYQRGARIWRKFYDKDGKLVTAQLVDLVDVIRERKKSNRDWELDELRLPKQVLGPQLMGDRVYHAGKVYGGKENPEDRRDFKLNQFPSHIRRAMMATDGMPLYRIPSFGAGAIREAAPEERVTLMQAAFGLGTTVTRLKVALAASGRGFRDGDFLDQAAIDKAAQHLIDHNAPII